MLLVAHAVEISIDAKRLGLMRESAGTGLAAALASLVRVRGKHRLT